MLALRIDPLLLLVLCVAPFAEAHSWPIAAARSGIGATTQNPAVLPSPAAPGNRNLGDVLING